MRAEFKTWTERDRSYAGKIILRPETPDEAEQMRAFAEHVGSDQLLFGSQKFEIVWSWKRVDDNRKKLEAKRHTELKVIAVPGIGAPG